MEGASCDSPSEDKRALTYSTKNDVLTNDFLGQIFRDFHTLHITLCHNPECDMALLLLQVSVSLSAPLESRTLTVTKHMYDTDKMIFPLLVPCQSLRLCVYGCKAVLHLLQMLP